MGLTIKERNELLGVISKRQGRNKNDIQGGCASVTVQIGGTTLSGQGEHDNLILLKAPPAVVTLVHKWAEENDHYVSMTYQGLEIR